MDTNFNKHLKKIYEAIVFNDFDKENYIEHDCIKEYIENNWEDDLQYILDSLDCEIEEFLALPFSSQKEKVQQILNDNEIFSI